MNIKQLIEKHDSENLINVLVNTWQQAEFAWNAKVDITSIKNRAFSNAILCGLGGSAISGNFFANFVTAELGIPFAVNRNYYLPKYAGPETLLILSSYSGNTEESVSALKEGLSRGCAIVCLSTGGQVKQLAEENNLPFVLLQAGFQPRYAFGNSFFALLKVFQELGLIGNYEEFVAGVIAQWKSAGELYATESNAAIELAEKLTGYIPVILSVSDVNEALGMRFKAQLNENAKLHAFSTALPEHNHNEVVAWEVWAEDQAKFATVIINDKTFHPQVAKRFSIISGLISSRGCPVLTVEGKGETLKQRLCELIYFLDWVSYYCAIVRGYDPAEIDNIHLLKKKLSE